MKVAVVKEKAKELGVKPGKMKKVELVHEIQKIEGNSPCFCSEIADVCGEMDCYWREDCKAM